MKYGIYQPMKYATAKSMDILKEALADPNYGISLKRDGASYVWAKDADGSVHLYGDRISKKTGEVIDKIDNVPHMKAYAEKHFPKETALIVEICAHYDYSRGVPVDKTKSQYVNGIMLCTGKKAAQRQEDLAPVEAYMFDVLFWDGMDIASMDFADRDTHAKSIYEGLQAEELANWFTRAVTYTEDKDELIADWIANGEEGGVLKMMHSTGRLSAKHHVRQIGETAARPMHVTYKIKQVDTVDVVITSVQMPSKAYQGKDPDNYPYRDEEGNPVNRLWALGYANGFAIGICDKDGRLYTIGTVASGLDDELREDAAKNPGKYQGKVIEVECMSIDKQARTLRHPRLMRFRPDKSLEQCTDEVFN